MALPARADVPVGVQAGYAFRSAVSALDDRAHGAAAAIVVDSPPLLWGFGLRGEGLALAWPGTVKLDVPLAVFGGGAALTYLFDDTHVKAVASLGGVAGVVVEGPDAGPTFGGTAGLLLRFPLSEAAALDARILLPLLVGDPRFNLQAAAVIGLSLSPDVVVAGMLAGRSPLSMVLPAFE